MIERYVQVICDNCNEVMRFYNVRVLDIYSAIRSRNWAVSKDREFTFCPKCKTKVSNVGRNGINKLLPFNHIKEKRRQQFLEFPEGRTLYCAKITSRIHGTSREYFQDIHECFDKIEFWNEQLGYEAEYEVYEKIN